MPTGSRERSDAAPEVTAAPRSDRPLDGPPERDPSLESSSGHPLWVAAAAATAGAWLGMTISVLGWFDEPLEIWFEVSKVATAVGACTGLGLAAVLTAVKAHRRRADEQGVRIPRYDVVSPRRG